MEIENRPNPKEKLRMSVHANGSIVIQCGLYKGRLNLEKRNIEYHCSIHEKDPMNGGEQYIATLSDTNLLRLIAEVCIELAKYQETAEEIQEKYGDQQRSYNRPPL